MRYVLLTLVGVMAGAGAAATVDAFSNDAEAITVSFKPAGRFEPFDVSVAALPESQFRGVRCGSGDIAAS